MKRPQETRPTPKELDEVLIYDPNNGLLFWKWRPSEMFSCQRSYKLWNAKHAGKPALMYNLLGYRVGTFKKHIEREFARIA